MLIFNLCHDNIEIENSTYRDYLSFIMKKDHDKIEDIDRKIVELLNERYTHLSELKKADVGVNNCYHPELDTLRLQHIQKSNSGPMLPETLHAIYREIISGELALNKPLTISYLGPKASFTHLAASAHFGHGVTYIPRNSITDVFCDVEARRSDYGCVPIENSTEGAVNHTLDMLIDSKVRICAEANMRIHHNLMSGCGFSEIRKVYSHAQVFGQCRCWLQEKLPAIDIIEINSTTRAAEIASKEPASAAIASYLAAELYGLNILAENIEDHADNTTRFMIIGDHETEPTGNDKTSIAFAVKEKVGALYECLLPFKENEITMTMIESRPAKRQNWQYCFFVDLLGHQSESGVAEVIGCLKQLCQWVKVLGSYPKSINNQK